MRCGVQLPGQRCGRPHVATWAETATVLAANLMAGDEDPCGHAAGLLRRRWARCLLGPAAGGYGCARTAATSPDNSPTPPCSPTSSSSSAALRIAPLWRILSGVAENDWADAIDRDGAQVALAEYCPDWWPAATRRLIRRVQLAPDRIGADPRARRRRTLHPDQRVTDRRARRGVWFLVHRNQPRRVHTGQGRRGRALIPAPHPGRERLPRRQARSGAATPALGISASQQGVDVGSAARGEHRRDGCTSSPPPPNPAGGWPAGVSATATP
jgi:hypothetical protein